MVFGLFKSWRVKAIEAIEGSHPGIENLRVGAKLTKERILHARKTLKIQSPHKMDSQITSFYLGAIEGDLRQSIDMSSMKMDVLAQIIILVALYTEIYDGVINNEKEQDAMNRLFHNSLFDQENDWYRKRGLGFTGLLREDPESNWEQFIGSLKA